MADCAITSSYTIMAQQLDFEGRVAIVTGGGVGIGKECALALAKRGAKVLVNDRGASAVGEIDTGPADSVVAAIKAGGGTAQANYDAVEYGKEIVKAAIRTYGRVDIVVNCAESHLAAKLGKMSRKDWDTVLTPSLFGTFSVTRQAWEYMHTHRYGRVVNVGSWTALYGDVAQANHAAAKMAVLGLTKALASEGSAFGIQTNAVLPLYGPKFAQQMHLSAKQMNHRFSPQMVATVMLYLAHESCKWNGEVVEAGGGVVDVVRWQRAAGAVFPSGFGPEEVCARWKEVEDFDTRKPKL